MNVYLESTRSHPKQKGALFALMAKYLCEYAFLAHSATPSERLYDSETRLLGVPSNHYPISNDGQSKCNVEY